LKTIAIDFETANEQRGSACSVGLAWIEDGKVTRVEERLIRPHDIRPADVEDSPEFPEVMDEFFDDFRDATMIAHNASFDFSVFRASCDTYRMAYPTLNYLCSVKMSQKVWPHLPSHKLNIIADHLRLRFMHHNAAEDAAVCAQATLEMAKSVGVEDIRLLPAKIGLTAGQLYPGGYVPCRVAKR
jgi:DNA polymerase-3 subunit epsilon